MKKLILLLPLFLLLQSCENDGSKDVFGDYTVCLYYDYEAIYRGSYIGYRYSDVDIYIYEYDSNNECVATHLWEDVKYTQSKTFTANKRAVKLVIGYEAEICHYSGITTENRYIGNVFYLDVDNYIEITSKTVFSFPFSSSNPIE
jgi:hypothetical protein